MCAKYLLVTVLPKCFGAPLRKATPCSPKISTSARQPSASSSVCLGFHIHRPNLSHYCPYPTSASLSSACPGLVKMWPAPVKVRLAVVNVRPVSALIATTKTAASIALVSRRFNHTQFWGLRKCFPATKFSTSISLTTQTEPQPPTLRAYCLIFVLFPVSSGFSTPRESKTTQKKR